MKIINLTQHNASEEQVKEGVFEPKEKQLVKGLLTIGKGDNDIAQRAVKLAEVAANEDAEYAMIGGAPFLMHTLVDALREKGIKPLYAFTERVSVDGPDGKKVSVFKHAGWRTPEGDEV